MTVTFASAAAAYASAAKKMTATPGLEAPGKAGDGFSDLVKQAAQSTIAGLKQGEAATLQAVTGKADIGQVVTAVANAELTLQTAVAVRDRVIQAYLDIIRMPI
jgi:flagellar hook-basal body complex protein FliE